MEVDPPPQPAAGATTTTELHPATTPEEAAPAPAPATEAPATEAPATTTTTATTTATPMPVDVAEAPEDDRTYLSDPKAYDKWKTLVPYIYDFFTNHHTSWPSLSCRWGPIEKSEKYKSRQKIYLSEQTDPSYGALDTNKLLVGHADVVKPRVATGDSLSKFHEKNRSPFIKIKKCIYHPGEVNKIRECPLHPHIVATKTDSCLTYIWNTERQPDRTKNKNFAEASVADLILEGHNSNAEFALAASHASPAFASGGEDNLVLLWSIEDEVTSLLSEKKEIGRVSVTSGGLGGLVSPSLKPRITMVGHTDTVEDCCFHPKNSHEVVSVGDDKTVRFWDARVGSSAVHVVEKAHNSDVQCVDWSSLDDNLVITGSEDASVKVFDRRKMQDPSGSELMHLQHHTKGILRVEWSPDERGIFSTAGADGLLNIWDLKKTQSLAQNVPSQLLFQHAGHRSEIQDFQWNREDPWTILSTSSDAILDGGGGTLQIWRMHDLIYRQEDEVLKELEDQRVRILGE